jgi:2-polyprenyl-3-methyl-5-hydroxy-6-metoxy-1,4-benzoquinol methylase
MFEGATMAPGEDRDTIERFTERYRVAPSEVTRLIEEAVIGGDWGANGYTTVAQADRLGSELDLRPASVLLDLGAGRGWPGLYLASVTGCRVVLADVPMEALQSAQQRAAEEALQARATMVRCNARDLPFVPSSFDAIVHTDVLC